MDFHVHYLSERYSINAEELRCLSRALGYPTSLLSTIFGVTGSERLPLQLLSSLMDLDTFSNTLHQTFNIYPIEWNRHVILTSILLLSYRSITFANLNLARCIFNFYEKEDGHGIVMNKSHLLQYIKMCNRIISPMKLSHRLKHMHNRLYYSNRLQLWEFLELILWSDVFESVEKATPTKLTSTKRNELYELSDDDISIVYTELKCFEFENNRYIKEELTYSKGNFKRILIIIDKPLKQQRESPKNQSLQEQTLKLSRDINRTNHMVNVSKGSCFKYYDKNTIRKNTEDNEKNRFPKSQSQRNYSSATVIQRSPSNLRPKTAPIVSTEDIEMLQKKKEKCKTEMENLDSKYHQKLQLDMEYMRPGFWQRWLNRPRPHTSYLTHVNIVTEKRPSEEYLRSLSKPRSGASTPYHNTCFRDIY